MVGTEGSLWDPCGDGALSDVFHGRIVAMKHNVLLCNYMVSFKPFPLTNLSTPKQKHFERLER